MTAQLTRARPGGDWSSAPSSQARWTRHYRSTAGTRRGRRSNRRFSGAGIRCTPPTRPGSPAVPGCRRAGAGDAGGSVLFPDRCRPVRRRIPLCIAHGRTCPSRGRRVVSRKCRALAGRCGLLCRCPIPRQPRCHRRARQDARSARDVFAAGSRLAGAAAAPGIDRRAGQILEEPGGRVLRHHQRDDRGPGPRLHAG